MRRIGRDVDFGSYGVLAVVVLALVLAYSLYPHPRRESRQEGVTEIVYWTPPGDVQDWMRPVVAEFERRNPQYKVLMGMATVRDAVGDPTRFLLSVAGGVPPDLIYFDRFAIVEWASRGAFTDLAPLIKRDRDLPDGIREENYFEPAWREPVYKGGIYAIANGIDTRAMYYLCDPLIRAGFVYSDDDPEVLEGKAQVGEPRPPKTWEEMCYKLVHAQGNATADGVITLSEYVRRPGVNEDFPSVNGASPAVDLQAAGVRVGDVIALVAGTEVFRGRIKEVSEGNRMLFDFDREQRPGLKTIPVEFRRNCEVKIFDQDGYVTKLTRFHPETGLMTSVAFIPLKFGNSWLYMYGWLNGAEFMSPDGTKCLLDSPEIVEALQWMTDVYDAQGGRKALSVFQTSTEVGALDDFLTEKVVMRTDGDWFMSNIVAFRPDLNFGVAPWPIPEKRRQAGHQSVGWSGGWSYAIPAMASPKKREAAWKFLRWLASVEANKIMWERQASLKHAKGQTFYPPMHPDKRVLAWLRETYVYNNPALSPRMIEAFNVFTNLLPSSKYRPVTPVGQKLWKEHERAAETATNHSKCPYDALSYGKRRVQIELERVFNPPTGPLVNWKVMIAGYVLFILLVLGTLALIQERKRRLQGGRRCVWLEGYICASPWLLGFIVFGAGPIIFSIIISFCHYDVLNPARFIGWTNYVNLLGTKHDEIVGQTVPNDPLFWKSLLNTAFMIVGVPLSIVAGLALAILLNTKVRWLQVYRTIYYLPAIVPAVAGFILWIWIFDPSRGLLNQVLAGWGIHDPPKWLQDPVWAKPALILMGLWAVGASMIIWLAGLKDIPESMYEAAAIDGASRLQRFRHITLPLLSPYILFNLIMGMIGTFQIFEAAYIMTDGGPADATLFYAYKLFNEAFRYLNMGVASAMAWIMFVVVLTITLFQLWLSKKWVHYGGQ